MDFWQAGIFGNKHYDAIFVKICPHLEKL